MQFLVQQSDLEKALNIVRNAISNRTVMEVLKGVLIRAYDNKLEINAFNMKFSITATIKCNVLKEGEAVLDYKLLSDSIRRLNNEDITFFLEDNVMRINCSQISLELLTMDPSQFPFLPSISMENTLKMTQFAFKEMIKMTKFAISKEEVRLILTGSYLEVKDRMAKMVCIDGYSIAIKKMPVDTNKNISVIIPGQLVSELEKILSSEIDTEMTIALEDNKIGFFFDNIAVISEILEGNYIDYKKVLPANMMAKIKLNKTEFQMALDLVSIMSIYGKNHLVTMNFKGNSLILESKSKMGSSLQEISVQKAGEDFVMGINPSKVLVALRNMECEEIEMHIELPTRPCLIKPVNDESYRYYIVPRQVRSNE